MEFRKNIISTGKEMKEAFHNGFDTNNVRIKFTEALELKGTEQYLSDYETYTFNTLFRASEDFKVPNKKTMTIKEFKKHITELDNNKNMEDKTMKLEKGDIIKTALSDESVVLDVKDNNATLFTGKQFVLASGIKENNKTGIFEWDSGRYADSMDKIANLQDKSYEDVRNLVEELGNSNYENFTKAIVSFEKGIDDINILDKVYAEFMDSDIKGLIHEDFDDFIAEYIEQENDIDYELDDDKEDVELDDEKDDNTRNINGYMATDVEIKILNNRDGEKFKVANFSIAENDDMGGVNYTKCTAYNDKIDKVKDFKKGDFVHLFGKEKISYGKDDKEYVNLSILSAKMLKEKKVYKETGKTQNNKKSKSMGKTKTDKKKTSVKSKLKEYKEKTDKTSKKSPKKAKVNER